MRTIINLTKIIVRGTTKQIIITIRHLWSLLKVDVRIGFTVIMILATIVTAQGQELSQVVRGQVIDSELKMTLPGANIIILGTDPVLGTVSDPDGQFRIPNVPLGRYSIQVSFVGYKPITIPEVLITSGREVILNVELRQSTNELEGITVRARSRKDQPINSMASISARSFTVEETRRYAGSVDDPARMVSAFAGVSVGNIQDNAIIVRGNSPKGISWRLEGVEIPNPNHFAGGNVAGGGFVTIFSSQLLANSDFYTGAFPAEYSNALAGVFDMKLRNGNNQKWEHTFQMGVMGIDFSSEGPFREGGQATYLFNYRYSTFALLNKIGVIPSDQVPIYQDLSFKLNFPTRNAGTFSLWGIGAIDWVQQQETRDTTEWNTDWSRISSDWNLNIGAAGISHRRAIGERTYINSTLSATGQSNIMEAWRFDDSIEKRPYWDVYDEFSKLSLNSFVNHRFSPKHTLRTGATYSLMHYNLDLWGVTSPHKPESFHNFALSTGNSGYTELYAQSRYSLSPTLTLNTGVNYNLFLLNNNYSIDPRVSLKWDFANSHAITFGYGKHSQLEELKIYFVTHTVDGQEVYPNKNLELSHAQHFILGYDWLINSNLRFKVEPYYQELYNVPGIPDSSYSMINFVQDWTFMNVLENNSEGRNIGIDLTLERFLSNNYYYLFTASVFDAKYKGDDGVWRNSRFNKGYVLNALAGREFFLKRNQVLGINARLTYTGGERYSPVNTPITMETRRVVFDESKAFQEKHPATCYLDLTVTYRMNKPRFSSVWALQVKNVLGAKSTDGYHYNYKTQSIEEMDYVVVVPVISYKIEF